MSNKHYKYTANIRIKIIIIPIVIILNEFVVLQPPIENIII